ncbi:Ferric siderophore transport system, periplasmic binding protein TonB [Lelliottia jeotgali]|nr:Ferric siderophore transport system, periplasmic binding protein TonB [Lelliottia jeotgali]
MTAVDIHPSWGKGVAVSVLAHLTVALAFMLHFTSPPPIASPAAVMVDYSPELEVSLILPTLPPGISQQRKVEEMSTEETPQLKEMPKLPTVEEAELHMAAHKPVQKSVKKPEKKKAPQQQRAEKGNATVTSRAAPPVQAIVSQRNAAPLDTDSTRISSSKINWESLVKGKINRMRNYPEDARKRKRTGTATIAFSVNNRGEIVASQLVDSSGTLSLDRAALAALQKAQPLPQPPAELLRNGIHKVTLPVEFNLLRI